MNEHEPNEDGSNENENTQGGAASAREAMAEAGPTDSAPEDAIASLDDFRVERDADGTRLPVTEPVPGQTRECGECNGTGALVEVTYENGDTITAPSDHPGLDQFDDEVKSPNPCPNCDGTGAIRVKVRVIPLNQGDANEYLPDDGNITKLDDDGTLELLQEFYVEPDFEELDTLDEIKAFGLDPLLMALMNASGFDMSAGMVAESSDLVQAVEGNSTTTS